MDGKRQSEWILDVIIVISLFAVVFCVSGNIIVISKGLL